MSLSYFSSLTVVLSKPWNFVSSACLAAAIFSSAFVPAVAIASFFAVSILPVNSVLAALIFSSAFVPASFTASVFAFADFSVAA